MRINKYIAACGVASRRKCEDLIKDGQIKVNGQVVTNLATDINEKKDRVEFEGKIIAPPKGFVYIKLNKPKGYICSASFCKHFAKRKNTINAKIQLIYLYGENSCSTTRFNKNIAFG